LATRSHEVGVLLAFDVVIPIALAIRTIDHFFFNYRDLLEKKRVVY
jgi:hypothetical protein